LLWSGGAWSDAALTIPHPALTDRAFVLGPLRAIVPEWRHPLSSHSIRQLAARLVRPKPVDRCVPAH
jgi:2-amino-4-hydroxy-6-hydroxymethyldihydropteridine diphosphokinase